MKDFKLCQMYIENKKITTELLTNLGYSKEDILKLENNNIIRKENDDNYIFISDKLLYQYGLLLESEHHYRIADLIYEIAYKMNPNNINVCLKMIKILVKRLYQKESQKKLFACLDVLYCIDDNNLRNRLDLYLFLLNNIIELPDYLTQYANSLDISNMKEESKDNKAMEANTIKDCIFNRKFFKASKLYKEYNIKYPDEDNFIITVLLANACDVKVDTNKRIYDLLKKCEYQNLINFLIMRREKCGLSLMEQYCLFLTSKLVNIKETGIIPVVKIDNTTNIFKAIDGNNFELALELYRKSNENNQKDVINYILEKIISEIFRIRKNRDSIKNDLLKEIKDALKNNNEELFEKLVQNYLGVFNKLEYFYLVLNIYILEGIDVMNFLDDISNDDFNLNDYLDYYMRVYQETSENKDLYLSVINNIKEINMSHITKKKVGRVYVK